RLGRGPVWPRRHHFLSSPFEGGRRLPLVCSQSSGNVTSRRCYARGGEYLRLACCSPCSWWERSRCAFSGLAAHGGGSNPTSPDAAIWSPDRSDQKTSRSIPVPAWPTYPQRTVVLYCGGHRYPAPYSPTTSTRPMRARSISLRQRKRPSNRTD